jgi:hypothetical protein
VNRAKLPKSRSPELIRTIRRKRRMSEDRLVREFRRSGETGYAKVKSPEARSLRVTWPADITRDDVDTWDVCHVSVS